MALERPDIDASAIINRMKEALGKDTDTDLASILEVSNKTVSSWRNRNSIPMEVIVSVAFASSKTVEYILTGSDVSVTLDELNEPDSAIMQIMGEKLLKNILAEYAEEKLVFMEDEDIRIKGIQIGAYLTLMYVHLHKAKKMLVEEAGLTVDKFIEFERRADEIDSDAINLRKRLREGK